MMIRHHNDQKQRNHLPVVIRITHDLFPVCPRKEHRTNRLRDWRAGCWRLEKVLRLIKNQPIFSHFCPHQINHLAILFCYYWCTHTSCHRYFVLLLFHRNIYFHHILSLLFRMEDIQNLFPDGKTSSSKWLRIVISQSNHNSYFIALLELADRGRKKPLMFDARSPAAMICINWWCSYSCVCLKWSLRVVIFMVNTWVHPWLYINSSTINSNIHGKYMVNTWYISIWVANKW